MAKQLFKQCLGVDIGSSSVKIAECSYERGSVRVNALLHIELPPFPDPESAEIGIAKIIKDQLKERKISTREAVFCLGGQQIFSRRVRLPDASEERLARIVNYEARQQIPFPPDKTRIEYQIFRLPGESEVEVLMVAARKDHIEGFMRLVARTGLRPIGLTVSSLALFNYFSFMMSPYFGEEGKKPKKGKEKKKKKGGKDAGANDAVDGEEAPEMELGEEGGDDFIAEEAKAILNIGESNTDLVIARKAKGITLSFMRSIPIAGREFSRFIQNSVGFETFAEADRVKREMCAAFPPDQSPPGDPGIDASASSALSEIIDTRLARQIQLSLDFFIAQPDGMAVDEITIAGGSSQISGIPEVLEDRLGIPVRRLEEPVVQEFLLNTTPPTDTANFAVACGEAIKGLGFGRVAIDFLPESNRIGINFPKVQIGIMAALLALMVFLAKDVGNAFIQSFERSAEEAEGLMQTLQPQQTSLSRVVTDRTQLDNQIEAFVKAFDAERRDLLVRFYAELTRVVRGTASQTILQSLDVSSFGDVTIEGLASTASAAPDILDEMNKTMAPFFDSAGQPALENNRPDANNVYAFRIRAKLANKESRIATPTPEPARASGAQAGGATGGAVSLRAE